MPNVVVKSPIQYLDRAASALKQIGVTVPKGEDAPINGLLQKISDLDQDKIAVIARTLGQASVFNEVVREHTRAMEIGDRYRDIAEGFNSVRDDAKKMVDQLPTRKSTCSTCQQRLDEDCARRHRRSLRAHQENLSGRDTLNQGPDRA